MNSICLINMPFFLNLYFQAPKHPLAHVSMQIQTKPRTPSLMVLFFMGSNPNIFFWAGILVTGKGYTSEAAVKGKVSQIYIRMIVHMHPWTAWTERIFLWCIQWTFETKHGTTGFGGLNRGCSIMKAIETGRNHQKFGRMSKSQLPIGFFSYIIQDRESPFDWVVYIRPRCNTNLNRRSFFIQ